MVVRAYFSNWKVEATYNELQLIMAAINSGVLSALNGIFLDGVKEALSFIAKDWAAYQKDETGDVNFDFMESMEKALAHFGAKKMIMKSAAAQSGGKTFVPEFALPRLEALVEKAYVGGREIPVCQAQRFNKGCGGQCCHECAVDNDGEVVERDGVPVCAACAKSMNFKTMDMPLSGNKKPNWQAYALKSDIDLMNPETMKAIIKYFKTTYKIKVPIEAFKPAESSSKKKGSKKVVSASRSAVEDEIKKPKRRTLAAAAKAAEESDSESETEAKVEETKPKRKGLHGLKKSVAPAPPASPDAEAKPEAEAGAEDSDSDSVFDMDE